MQGGHCVRTVHAEINALAQAARSGVRVDGATVYLTTYPCWPCTKALLNAGITRIVYAESYRPDPLVVSHTAALGVELVQVPVATS
jgi:dCMP deaminase